MSDGTQKIGKFSLINQGGYVCKMKVDYRRHSNHAWSQADLSGPLAIGMSESKDPGDAGVPDGDEVRLYVSVVAGNDMTAQQTFIYKKSKNEVANYVASGTTFDDSLALSGVS